MARIFISYKRVDKEPVFKFKDRVESALGEKCWIDIDGIESDAQFKNVIIRAINACEIVLFMYSKTHSKILDFEKDWTVRELNFAQKKGKRIVFVNIDGSSLTDAFEFDYGTKQQVDARNPESVNRLIEDLRNWLHITAVEPAEPQVQQISPSIIVPKENEPVRLPLLKRLWVKFVFGVHVSLSLFTLLAAFGGEWLLLCTTLFAIAGTYGTWRTMKGQSYSYLLTAAGDLLATSTLFIMTDRDAAIFMVLFVILCLSFHWVVMHVSLSTSH